jgi:hypothetical protein
MTIQPPMPAFELSHVTVAADRAARAIPPAWPLASSVAVNPYLGQANASLADTGARLARVAGLPVTLPRAHYAARIASGAISEADLAGALAAAPPALRPASIAALVELAKQPARSADALPTVADLAAEASGIDWPAIIAERFGAWAASQFDEANGLAIALRLSHSKIVLEARLRIAALLMADDDDRSPTETRKAAKDGIVIHELAIARELDEFVEQPRDIIEKVRPVGMTRDLRLLPRIEMGIDVLKLLVRLLAQLADFLADSCAARGFELGDLLLEIGDRFFEFKIGRYGHGEAPPNETATYLQPLTSASMPKLNT